MKTNRLFVAGEGFRSSNRFSIFSTHGNEATRQLGNEEVCLCVVCSLVGVIVGQ